MVALNTTLSPAAITKLKKVEEFKELIPAYLPTNKETAKTSYEIYKNLPQSLQEMVSDRDLQKILSDWYENNHFNGIRMVYKRTKNQSCQRGHFYKEGGK